MHTRMREVTGAFAALATLPVRVGTSSPGTPVLGCQGSGAEALELSVNIGGDPEFERRVVPVGPQAPPR